jgi:hypothetical protein
LVISGSFRWVDGELPFLLHQLIPPARSCKSEDDFHGIDHCYGGGKGHGRSNSGNATSNFANRPIGLPVSQLRHLDAKKGATARYPSAKYALPSKTIATICGMRNDR